MVATKVVAFSASSWVAAAASPITYTFSVVATGTIRSTSFTNQTITFVATTDTTLITGTPPKQSSQPLSNVTVIIGSIGTGILANSAIITGHHSYVQLASGDGAITVLNPGAIPFNYDLRTPLGVRDWQYSRV